MKAEAVRAKFASSWCRSRGPISTWRRIALIAALGAARAGYAAPKPASDAPASDAPAAGAPPAGAPPAEPPAALSKAPRLAHFVEAVPPASLAARGRADVVLTIDVDEKGKVTAVEVAQSAALGDDPGDAYDTAAVAAARQFVFEPGESEGKPVPVRITYSYHFLLKPPPPPPAPPAAAEARGPAVPLTGTVLRKGDRVPLAGVAVIVDGGAAGERRAVTDAGGHFAFDALPVGDRALKLRGPSTAPADATVALHEGRALEVTYYLDAKDRYASTVRGKRPLAETVEHTLRVEEIQRIPGTQGDTLKAVQNLPGVARAPFGIGLLSVWGSAPQDTRVYIDGVPVPTLYHFGGLRSTINSEMVQSLTFVPGAYRAEHGLGLGGVIDIDSRKPRTDGFHGYAQMDLLDGSLMLEGPITKTLSFAVAARRSWIDVTLPWFTSSSLQLSPRYWDYQARLSWRPNPRDDVDLFFLGSDDQINVTGRVKDTAFSTTADSHIFYHRGIASWLHRFGGGATLKLTSSVGYDVPFQLGIQYGSVPTSIDMNTFSYTARAVAAVPIASWLHLDTGIDYEGSRFKMVRAGVAQPPTGGVTGSSGGGFGSGSGDFSGTRSGYAVDDLTLYTNNVAPFASATLALFNKRLTITPQLRLQVMTFTGYQGTPDAFARAFVSPEPRLAVRYKLSERLSLKAAAGMYAQPPTPDMFSRVFGNPALTPEHGMQYVAGADVDVTPTLHVEAEGFYKSLDHLVVPGANPGDAALVNDGRGRMYGAEVLVRQELTRNFFGWLSYTFSRSERQDHPGEAYHRFQFDQTHILTLMASYVLPRGFQVGARYRYVTGNPYTPVVGAFYDSNGDRYTAIQGAPFSTRLPAFSQLDVRVDKVWTFDRWRLSLYLDVQNVMRSKNPEAIGYNYNFRTPYPVSGLPLLPIIGLRGDF